MSRQRLYVSNAEKQRAYRARKRAAFAVPRKRVWDTAKERERKRAYRERLRGASPVAPAPEGAAPLTRIELRLNEPEKPCWVEAAHARGMSLSGFIRGSVRREITRSSMNAAQQEEIQFRLIEFRVSAEEARLLAEAARRRGLSLNAWLRLGTVAAASQEVAATTKEA